MQGPRNVENNVKHVAPALEKMAVFRTTSTARVDTVDGSVALVAGIQNLSLSINNR